jgi:hypothetical protein
METPGHTFTAGMRSPGHTDLPGDVFLDHHERLEVAAAIDREIDRDDA